MESVTKHLARRLKLTVNADKSAVDHPMARAFLGFSFMTVPQARRRIASQTVARFKVWVRQPTRGTKGVSLVHLVRGLSRYLIGRRGVSASARPLRCPGEGCTDAGRLLGYPRAPRAGIASGLSGTGWVPWRK